MDGRVTVGADALGREASVEAGYEGVAAVAELGDTLETELVAVRRAMRRVTGDTSLRPDRAVLKDEGPAFVTVALNAGVLFEASQPGSCGRLVGVVARGALHGAFFDGMVVAEEELAENAGVTLDAGI